MKKEDFLHELQSFGIIKCGKEKFFAQSIPQKVFSSVWALEFELFNGGFQQYFLNNSAETAGFIVEALNMIEAQHKSSVCSRAISCAFPQGLPTSPSEISSAAANFPERIVLQLDFLDIEFDSTPDNLTDLLYAPMRKNIPRNLECYRRSSLISKIKYFLNKRIPAN